MDGNIAMNSEFENTSKEDAQQLPQGDLIEGVFSCIKRDVFHDGACQCYSDCDCHKRMGEFLYQEVKFKHPLSSKKFKTLATCKESYETLKAKT